MAFYRRHRELFTGFQWIYLKFGPWIEDYDDLIAQMEANGIIEVTKGTRADFFSTRERIDSDEFIERAADDLLLRGIISKWGEQETNRILDYVYFLTEPMIHGTRYEPLDFSTIPEETRLEYKRLASGKTAREIEQLRERLLARLAENRERPRFQKVTEPIEYDDVFYKGMQAFEEAD